MAKQLTMLMVLISFSIGVLGQPATSFPAMKGVVSDYAGRLDEAQIKELSGLLKDYERQTTRQIPVIILEPTG